MGMFGHSLIYLEDAGEIEPDHREVLVILGAVLVELGKFAAAESLLEECLETYLEVEALGYLGYLYAKQGKLKLSLEIIDRINSTASNGEFVAVTKARIHFVLGEKNTGYEILENWVDKKGSDLIAINVDPRWKAFVMKNDSESFKKLAYLRNFERVTKIKQPAERRAVRCGMEICKLI